MVLALVRPLIFNGCFRIRVLPAAADTGGEFVAAASLDLSWFPEKDWFVPTEDLVNIYAALNATGDGPLVEAQWINECAVLFYAGEDTIGYWQ